MSEIPGIWKVDCNNQYNCVVIIFLIESQTYCILALCK